MIQAVEHALKKVGIERLNELQLKAYPAVSSGRDVIIVAPTGSGKTEAALIPLIEKIMAENLPGIALLYVTPLRALNRDMLRRIEVLARELHLSVAVRHGDTGSSERRRQSLKPPHIVITTPETFQILFLGKRLRSALKNVRFVVLDEVHELADSERGVQLSVALERLRKLTKFQTVCLSATVKNPEKVARFFGGKMEVIAHDTAKEYDFTVVKPEETEEDEKISQELFVDVDVAAELRFIRDVVNSHRSALIFVNTRQTAEALGLKLKKLIDVEVHHGSLSKEVRIDSEARFAAGELKALICTSSMELGIDIGHVDVVIQYNSPREVARLVQRVGRSGHREGVVSKGYIIASSFDDIMESWIIAKKALNHEIEDIKFHELSLDTLANQISAMALEYGSIDAEEMFAILRKAYPFRRLSFEEFLEICQFLNDANIIYFDGERISALRKSRRYFYDNISMIPDERHYPVVDITVGKRIGVLDETFLTTFSGEVFAMRGELWKVVGVDDVVKVEPVTREGEIPSWVGEEIPVPFEVAQDVGRLRKRIADMLVSEGREKTVSWLMREFSSSKKACEEVVDVIQEQLQKGFELPTHDTITVEGRDTAIINACFGHRVNETIGRIVALLLSARKGQNVAIEVDPYRIKLSPASSQEVVEVLREIRSDAVESLAERGLADTRLLQWKVINAARKFGYLSKDLELSRINLKKLVARFIGTPVYREALRELFVEKLDVERAKQVFDSIRSGEVQVVAYKELSPISLASRDHVFDLLMPARPTKAILRIFRKRLEEEFCVVKCLGCGYSIRCRVKDVELSCPRCRSRLIACVSARRGVEDVSKSELFRIANLVMAYGMKAVFAMNTYGVGVENASRILSRYYPDEDSFFMELMEAEKRFIRTRKFWD